jgi:hypothetical protein
MPGKITELAALTSADPADMFEVVDVSDTSMAVTGTNKRITLSGLATQPVATQAGTTYTIAATDAGVLTRLTGTATITLPSGGLGTGQRSDFVCIGGPATFVLGSGATWDVAPTPSTVARETGSVVTAVKTGATTWVLVGDLA